MKKTSFALTSVKLLVFTVVMALIFAGLVVVFSQYRTGSTEDYKAVFTDASGLETGDKVRIAGVVVGAVDEVRITDDSLAQVKFNVDDDQTLRHNTHVNVRYEDLVGNRFLEIVEGEGETTPIEPGDLIPVDRTEPALDLDILLGGFKPLFRNLDPDEVNVLAASLLDSFQGQSQTLVSLLSSSSSFATTIADRDALVGEVIDNLNAVLATMDDHRDEFSSIVDNVEKVVEELGGNSVAVVDAIGSLDGAAGEMAGLLTEKRGELHKDMVELDRLSELLDEEETSERLEWVMENMPPVFAQLVRVGTYGAFFNFYICGLVFKLDGPGGNPIRIPFQDQRDGRCAPVDAY